MKTILALLMSMSALLGMGGRYALPEAPQGITVKILTENGIKEEVKFERKQREYKQAAAIAGRVYRQLGCRQTYAAATGKAAVEFGVSPRILAAVVFVESSCNPAAVSGRDSVGLTQVNPRVWHYNRKDLKDPERNLRIGASILASYMRRFGLVEGLHHYNGLGNPSTEYATKVLTAAGMRGIMPLTSS